MLIKISPAVFLNPNHILTIADDAVADLQGGLLKAQLSDSAAKILPVVRLAASQL